MKEILNPFRSKEMKGNDEKENNDERNEERSFLEGHEAIATMNKI